MFYMECKRVSGGLLLCAGSSVCCAVSTAELTQSFFGMLQVSRCTYALFFLGCCKVFSLCERVLNRTASKRFSDYCKVPVCVCVLLGLLQFNFSLLGWYKFLFGLLKASRLCVRAFSFLDCCEAFRCVGVLFTGLLQNVSFGLLQSLSFVVRVYFFLGLLQSFSFSLWVCNFLGLLDAKFLVSRVRAFLGLLISLSLCGRALNRAATKRVLG